MPRRLTAASLAACGLVLLWASGASGWAHDVVPLPTLTMTFSLSVTPKKLSRVEATPIALDLKSEIETSDGSHPPALQEFVIDLDRHIAIDARGLPVCNGGNRDLRFPDLESICRDAIVGRGKVWAQFQFPEWPPISSASDVTVFNAGGGPRKLTLYAVAYFTQPIVTGLSMMIQITKHPDGSQAIIKVPELANGAGSLTYLNAKLKKRFARNGEAIDFLTGSCPTGKIQSEVRALFRSGALFHGETLQTCIPQSH